MMQKFVNLLASDPRVFMLLRRILEGNFNAQKKALQDDFTAKDGEKVLDIGCGTGEFSVFFQNAAYTGIDAEKKYIDYAQRNCKGKFLIADASHLPFSENAFDKVIIMGVLHHMNDEQCRRVLAEARRVLSSNGRMLVMEDIKLAEENFLTRFIHRFDLGKNIRNKEEYRILLQRHFAVEKEFTIQNGLSPYRVFILRPL